MVETVILLAIGLFCGMIPGFWLGRLSARYYVGGNEDETTGESAEENVWESAENGSFSNEVPKYDKRKLSEAGLSLISSPVGGHIIEYGNGKRPEVRINPEVEKLYAPAGGKVIRLFPMGNELLFRTEDAVVLRIKVGDDVDELQSEYFRPKVIQNEVVNRGKLLLEFDRKSLEAEGVECRVSVCVEEVEPGRQVSGTAVGSVKVGEAVFEIVQK